MKKIKLLITLLLAASMIIGVVSASTAIPVKDLIVGETDVEITDFDKIQPAAGDTVFEDVKRSSWYHTPIKFLYDNEIVNGVTETEFMPNKKITRAEIMTMLCRAFGFPAEEGEDNFDDCKGKWYSGYVYAAKKRGIAGGVGGNNFAPEDYVTHEQALKLIIGCVAAAGDMCYEAHSPEPDAEYFKETEVSPWAEEYVRVAKVAGFDLDRLKPTREATRAQVALFLYDALAIAEYV